jgi:hypothetical protein
MHPVPDRTDEPQHVPDVPEMPKIQTKIVLETGKYQRTQPYQEGKKNSCGTSEA